MNLAQFQIILQKINALDKNISMDGKISSIEKDLMKAYVSQLYEACVNDDSIDTAPQTPNVEAVVTPPTPVQSTPSPTPIEQAIQQPVQQPAQQVVEQPVQQVVEPTAPIVEPTPVATPEPVVNPEPAVQNKLQDLNDRIAANTKTVADKLANPQAKSLNDRLADKSVNKTFNDRFNKPEKSTANTNISAPKMVVIPDSIKHLDNSSNAPQSTTPTAKVTPPPPPAPNPTPVQQPVVEPVVNVAPVTGHANTGTININDIHSLFDEQHANEAAGKWGSTAIQDISKSIGLNDKISMIKELFNDDHHAFNNSLAQLNNLGSFEEAKDYMMRNMITVFKWNEGQKLERAKQLINLVRRRYK